MTNTYTIGEIADKFGLHKDTLRNWEKDGLVVPDRVGPRGDRVYTDEHIAIIVDKKLAQSVSSLGSTATMDTDKMSLAQLKTFLWKSADILRGKIDSSDYKKYIFGLLFYKRMSDVWQEEYEKALAEYHDDEIAKADYNHRFQVPEDAQWEVVQNTATDIGLKLNEVFDKITNANSPKLDKIFDDLDFANSDRFPNETLQRLINHFSKHRFGETYFSSDVLGDAYEYLIQQFAADAGKKGGEFYTPREVERLIMHILKPHEKDHIYDPAVGSGGFLLEAYHYTREKDGEQKARSLYLYGQEINISTYAIGKINMFLHGLDGADIRRGDTLVDPQFQTAAGTLKTFDIVVANFPYSIKEWPYEVFKNDRYGRHDGYETPPAKNADYAFVLHILKSLNENGRAGIVVPHGVLFRGNAEGKIRQKIINDDFIEAVVSLPPKLFYGTSIPAAILVFNKNKSADRKNQVIFVDAENDYEPGKKQNRLRKSDIEKISKTVQDFRSVKGYAEVATIEDIAAKDHILNVRRYVDAQSTHENFDIKAVARDLENLVEESQVVKLEAAELLKTVHAAKQETKQKDTSIGKVPSEWEVVQTEGLTDGSKGTIKIGPFGSSLKKAYLQTSGFKVYGQENVFDNDFSIGDRYISEERFKLLKSCELVPGDFVISMMGTIGQCTVVPEGIEPGIMDSHLLRIKLDPTKADADYVSQLFKSNVVQSQIIRMSVGGIMSGLSSKIIRSLVLPLPPLREQQRIARVLKAADAQVESTQQIVLLEKNLKTGLMQDLLVGSVRI